MTPKDLILIVAELDVVSTEMIHWLNYGGRFVTREEKDQFAASYARLAGHYANQLIDLAERGEQRAA